ncbi:hypothetical protein LCL87_14285 [Rhodococcus hoagii]|nr:hypothetical protein [Prescottella equi]
MGWVSRQVWIASGVGAVVGVSESAPSGFGVQTWPALVLGAFAGVVVGLASVMGGHLAVRSAEVWPPRSSMSWRHRFAVCSSAVVFLLTAGCFAWIIVSAGAAADQSDGRYFLGVSAAFAAVTYAFTVFLAPVLPSGNGITRRPRVQRRP